MPPVVVLKDVNGTLVHPRPEPIKNARFIETLVKNPKRPDFRKLIMRRPQQ